MTGVRTTTVIRAIHDLHGRSDEHADVWPTKAEIAAYLKVDEALVGPPLKQLLDARLFQPRQRKGRRVWMPWA